MFNWPIRVYYEDTDCGGGVYHSNYLKFMEQARTEWLRNIDFEQDVLIAEHGVIFAVRSLSIDYINSQKKRYTFPDYNTYTNKSLVTLSGGSLNSNCL